MIRHQRGGPKNRTTAGAQADIRPAGAGDVAAIRRVVHEAYAIYLPRIGREPAPVAADYEALIAAGAVWVATSDDEVVGVLVLQREQGSLLLENVAVAPAAQGRGLGRALIAFAEQRAHELGLAEITLYTNARMTENLAFYTALGYTEIARRNEHGFDRVFFKKATKSA